MVKYRLISSSVEFEKMVYFYIFFQLSLLNFRIWEIQEKFQINDQIDGVYSNKVNSLAIVCH